MRRTLAVLIAIAAALMLAAYLALPAVTSSPGFRKAVLSLARDRTGWEITLEQLHIGYGLALTATGVSIAEPGHEPFLSAGEFRISTPWVRPDRFGYKLGRIVLSDAELDLDRLPTTNTTETVDDGPAKTTGIAFSDALLHGAVIHATIAGARRRIGPIDAVINDRGERTIGLRASATLIARTPIVHATGTLHNPGGITPAIDLELEWEDVPLDAVAEFVERIIPTHASGRFDARVRLHADAEGVTVEADTDGVTLRDTTLEHEGAAIRAKELGLQGRLLSNGAGSLTVDVQVRAREVSANDPSYSRLAEKLAGNVDLNIVIAEVKNARGEENSDAIMGTVAVNIESGEALWDKFYIDLKRFIVSASSKIDTTDDVVRLDEARLTVRGVGGWTGDARIDPAGGRYDATGRFEIVHIGRFLEIAVREPFKESFPALAAALAEGELKGDLSSTVYGDGRFSVYGEAKLSGGKLEWQDPPFKLKDVSFNLPIALGTAPVKDRERHGKFRIGVIEAMGTRMVDIQAPITTRANAFSIDTEIRAEFHDGTVTLGRLSADHILHGARMETSMALADVNLSALLSGLGLTYTGGALRGRLDPLVYTEGRITSQGTLSAKAFGGTFEAGNIGISELFSPVPAFSTDLRFRDLNLATLSAAFEAGHISGLLEGEIAALEIVDGQPVAMEARIQTTPRRGVPQNISVAAINQISILGGSGSDPISRGLLSFFDNYRYAKMGFSARLRNDRFTVRGVEQYDGKDFLVVGSIFPPTVNVISHSQVIAFSEMVRRLTRIRTAGSPRVKEPVEK